MKSLRKLLNGLLALGIVLQLGGCVGVAAVGAGAATGAAAAIDRRTTGTLVDDELIEWKVGNNIGKDSELAAQSHINVTSYNNMVLLTGEVPTQALKTRVGQLAREVQKVRGIFNEIEIVAPSSLLSRSSDTVVTGKVKTALLAAESVEATRVKVVTESGTLYLMGLVTRAQAENTTEVSRRVGGVRRVVRLFEYLD